MNGPGGLRGGGAFWAAAIMLGCAMLLREQPIWTMGQYQDDAVLSAYRANYLSQGKNLWDFAVDMFRNLALYQGRIAPVSAFFVVPLWVGVEDNLFLYRAFQVGFQLAALGAFLLFVRALTRDRFAALLCAALYVAMVEVRDYHDPTHSYFILLPFIVAIGSLACYFAVVAGQAQRTFDRSTWMVVALNTVGILTYELVVPFAALSCLILVSTGPLPLKQRFLRALVAGLPVVVVVIAGMVAKATVSQYGGTQVGSLSAAVILPAFAKHVSAGIPLTYWWNDPHQHLAGLLVGTRAYPASLLSAAALALLLGGCAFISLMKTRAAPHLGLAVVGVLLLLAPAGIISLSLKYQQEAVIGVGYLQSAISYLGTSSLLLLVLLIVGAAFARVGEPFKIAFAAVAGIGIAVIGAISLASSYRVAQAVNENWRYPREQLEVWLHAVRPQPGVAEQLIAIDRPWLYRWEAPAFLQQHWGAHGKFVTLKELPSGSTPIQLRTPERPHPSALNLFIDAFPGGAQSTTHAIVMCTDRERLAAPALYLSLGQQSWPFAAEVKRGRHGYYYREVSVPGNPAGVGAFGLLVARPGNPAALPPPATIEWLQGRYTDGWVADRFELRNGGSEPVTVSLALWNPSPQSRHYTLEGITPAVRGALDRGARTTVAFELGPRQAVQGSVSPAFLPGGGDPRKLGLRVEAQVTAGRNAPR